MRARKNVANLTSAERAAFVGALLELHRRPSQRGLANRYDDFAKIHVDAMSAPDNWGHRGPVFTAWHRVLLDQLERDLRPPPGHPARPRAARRRPRGAPP